MTATRKLGVVFDIKRYTLHDGPGIRATVHLKGCPLSCWWCHNPESQNFKPQLLYRAERCIACDMCVGACPNGAVSAQSGRMFTDPSVCDGSGACADVCPSCAREICGVRMSVDEVMEPILKERIFFEQSGGGVTLSGGEPLGQPEFVMRLLSECKRLDIHTALDTSGFVNSKILLDTIPVTDLYLYDIKHMDPEEHKKYTGVDNDVILSNLSRLGEAGAAINARMPFVPGVNTDAGNLRATAVFLSSARGITGLNLLPYHSAAEDKHGRWGVGFRLSGIHAPTETSLRRAAELMENYGVRTAIGG
ncbi:MAG: glycyl-radical enzyme activating protein [Synergistaceae bacterium]|nr:glycyl-radical enzyme activating protein [Synergistaceae bacterium]